MLKRTLSGTLVTTAGTVITALQQLLLVPLFLWAWGKDVYGEWLAIYAVVVYLPLLNIGMQNCVINGLTQSRSKGDMSEYIRILHSTLRLYLLVTVSFAFVYGLFVFLAPFTSWLKIVKTPEMEVRYATFILGLYMLSTIPFGLATGVYQSLGQFPRKAMVGSMQQVLLILLLTIVLFLKGSMVMASLVHCIAIAAVIFYVVFDVQRRYPDVKFGFSHADWEVAIKFIVPSLFFFVISLSYMIKLQGSVLVISSILGSGAVAVFCIHRTLANVIWQMVNPTRLAVWPEITAADASGREAQVRLLHNALMKLTLFMSISFAIFLYFSGENIIRMWTGGKIGFQSSLWLLLLIYLPITCVFENSALFQMSTNKHYRVAICQITSVTFGIILSIMLTKVWGITGALLGFVIADASICWIIPLGTIKLVKTTKSEFIFNIILKSGWVAVPQFFFAWILYHNISNIFIQWAVILIVIFLVGLATTYFLWLTNEESEIARGFIRKIRRLPIVKTGC